MATRVEAAPRAEESAVITKATLRAAERLEVTARALSVIIGVSEATVSRMRKNEFLLDKGSKPFELAVLFIRLFRSLDAITGGDETVARTWLRSANTVLGGKPLEKILTVSGLVDVIAYLDARRALV